MKLPMTVEADTVSILPRSRGRIAVDIKGIELASLIDVVCDNGYSLRVALTNSAALQPSVEQALNDVRMMHYLRLLLSPQ
ncbi:TPA: DUF5983 family protein [Salmonella enterica subsp. enterica serovar Bahrenfeld]